MRAAILALLIASPVAAQEVTLSEREDGIYIRYENHLTMWRPVNEVEGFTFESSLGPVVAQLTRTPNDQCAESCPDLLEVLDVPPGLVAIPPVVELPEGATTEVRILKFEGV